MNEATNEATRGHPYAAPMRPHPAQAGLGTRIWTLLRVDWRFMTFNAFVNTILGSTFVPRPLRTLGLRVIGADVRSLNIYPGVQLYLSRGRYLRVGKGTLLNHGVLIEANAPVHIGAGVLVAHQVSILTSHHDRLPDGTVSPYVSPRPVTIGDGAWIGARAVLCPGVTIGPRVTIAAGAVVTRDCPEAGATYGGVPARRLR